MRDIWNPRKFVIATGAALALAACSDAPTAPTSAATPMRGAAVLDAVAGGVPASANVSIFIVRPSDSQTYSLTNGNKITFSAQAICDPATTSYGRTEWDAPCDPATRPVTITAWIWYEADGHPHVQFSPRLRFNPAAGPVTLYLKDKNGLSPDYGIVYCPDDGSGCYDESVLDPSLTTYRSTASGNFYFRRLKHFSGYNIASGRSVESALQ